MRATVVVTVAALSVVIFNILRQSPVSRLMYEGSIPHATDGYGQKAQLTGCGHSAC